MLILLPRVHYVHPIHRMCRDQEPTHFMSSRALPSMALKTLSSGQTFTAKFIFPVTWISMFGLGTLSMWSQPAHTGTGVTPEDQGLLFLALWIIGTLFLLIGPARLKRIRADTENIYVSNYLREIVIPVENISDVTENRLLNWHPVRVQFRVPTTFGTSVVFMPKLRWFGLWSSHPVVAELKALAQCR
jgi:hypothetical protein